MKVVFVEIETLISYNYAYFLVLKYTNKNKLNSFYLKRVILIGHIKV